MTPREWMAIAGLQLMAVAVLMFAADVFGWPVPLGLGLGMLVVIWRTA